MLLLELVSRLDGATEIGVSESPGSERTGMEDPGFSKSPGCSERTGVEDSGFSKSSGCSGHSGHSDESSDIPGCSEGRFVTSSNSGDLFRSANGVTVLSKVVDSWTVECSSAGDEFGPRETTTDEPGSDVFAVGVYAGGGSSGTFDTSACSFGETARLGIPSGYSSA